MKKGNAMFKFSSKLWINKRRVNKETGIVSLYLQATINRGHDEFPLLLTWPLDKINFESEKLLSRHPKDNEVDDYNLIIQCEKAKHTEIQLTYRLRKEDLTIQKFALELKTFDGKECFITFFRTEVDRRYRKKEIEKKTWQNGKAVLSLIMQFDNLSLFKNINIKWLQDFRLFLQNKEFRPGEYYKPGTIWDRLKTTMAYLTIASEEPMLIVDQSIFKFKFDNPSEDTTYLDKEELRRLIMLLEYDITNLEKRILRAFLFCCFTSIRISDLYLINYQWEIQANFLDFVPYKNRKKGRKLRIPFLPIARNFISNNKGLSFFDLPNRVQYNVTLKTIADKAFINKNLTAHVSRHTFGYLYMTSVKDIYGLQKILGHAKIETTQRYAHIDDEYKFNMTSKIQDEFRDLVMKVV